MFSGKIWTEIRKTQNETFLKLIIQVHLTKKVMKNKTFF